MGRMLMLMLLWLRILEGSWSLGCWGRRGYERCKFRIGWVIMMLWLSFLEFSLALVLT